jgi:hypothetical protein
MLGPIAYIASFHYHDRHQDGRSDYMQTRGTTATLAQPDAFCDTGPCHASPFRAIALRCREALPFMRFACISVYHTREAPCPILRRSL